MSRGQPSHGWIAVRIEAGGRRGEVASALFEAGADAVQEDGTRLVAHAASPAAADAFVCAALAVDPAVRVETEPLADVDWSEEWKRGIRVQHVGALRVAPPWLAEGLDPATTIVIEPAMAFGTGDHATTRGVLRLLQRVIRAGDVVADLGAGSAVLAIAAAKRGAARVAAIEIDPDAIGNAEENVARNGVADRVRVIEGDAATLLPLMAPVRVVTANILSSVILELLPVIARALAPDGVAILSGILGAERAGMVDALSCAGWRVVDEEVEDAWWSAIVAR